jgi:hypothetical protein
MTEVFVPPCPLKTAVLFLVFNRADTTAQVFQAIRNAKPPRLYVAADGPREDRVGEAEHIAKVRQISTAVDWPCELKTLFRENNLGCKYAVSGAITWFFEQEEQGIILEDDCLPSQSFFWFCEELLERHKNDERIFIISGYNKQGEWRPDDFDYFFSFLGGIWGWASWRRAWKYYDGEMSALENMRAADAFVQQMGHRLGRLRERQFASAIKKIESGEMNTWAFPWGLSRNAHGGLACVPSRSLIRNIGFGQDATHTAFGIADKVSKHEIRLPTRANPDVRPCKDYDLLFIAEKSLLLRLILKAKTLLNKRCR